MSTSFRWITAVTSLAFVVAQLDVSIVNIALPEIAKTFKADMSVLQWVIDAYALAFAVLMLSAGNLSDLFGARQVFQWGMLIFGAASIGCGFAGNAGMLIAWRAVQGLGAATMIPSSLAILNQHFAHLPEIRARAVGLWTAAGSAAIAAGPIAGGVIISVSNWRYIFFVNAPLCILGMLLTLGLPKNELPELKRKIDFPGTIAWMIAITTLIGAIIEGPKLSITHPLIYGACILSAISFIVFIILEKKGTHPMLPLYLFHSGSFNVLLLLGALLNGFYYGTVFILSLYLQNVLHYSSLTAGFAFLPLTIGFVISNLASAAIINKFGIRKPILAGLIMFALGFAGLLIANEQTPYWQLFLPFLVIPMGMGLAVPAMTTGILSSVDKQLSGTASAALNTVRQAAGATGVAILGAAAAGDSTDILHAISLSVHVAIACTFLLMVLIYLKLKARY
ncbi:MFS transporter [Chitinophaga silvisoli]|uniref:MFS transporter n=1 Tax=Chitinophaga silvisoli TaxID=2291814 RepID=A0A3E1NT57_9BACT|nr:MFS transporter [Chitinophaga silvisoli]RFM31129.1 MFS transporter [Chitinophaga silvisoli]